MNSGSVNGIYNISDQDNNSFPVYCDFGSEPGFVWTLIQSHSLQNKGAFTSKAFYLHDMPINQDAPEWNNYRLSMSRMMFIQSTSTHWRGTCNFQNDGVVYRDYIRVSLEQLTLLPKTHPDGFCLLSEFINIRGQECTNCTIWVSYDHLHSLHVDSSLIGYNLGCQFPDGGTYDEDNFGQYVVTNPAFRCTSSSSSTSQIWLGSF